MDIVEELYTNAVAPSLFTLCKERAQVNRLDHFNVEDEGNYSLVSQHDNTT